MTPVRKCVQDIIDMSDTGLSLDELEGMRKRIARYLDAVPKGRKNAARELLIETMRNASASTTMKPEASELLHSAIIHVEQMGSSDD